MSAAKQLRLANTSGGRMLLHFMALVQDHRLRWHLAGVIRELKAIKC